MSKTAKRASYRDHLSAMKALDSRRQGLPAEPSLYLLYGTSEYLLDRALKCLQQRAADTGMPYVTLEAASVTESLVSAMGSQGALFEPATFYVLRRCEQARSLAKQLKLLSDGKLANRIALLYRGESPPAPLRNELTRLKHVAIPCFEPWPNEFPQVLEAAALRHKLKLTPPAIQLLIEVNGTDLVKQENELFRLSLIYKDADKPLDSADIAPHLGLLREDEAFELDKLLLQRQWAKAAALSTQLLNRGEKGLALLGILSNHCRNVLKVHDALQQGVRPQELGGRVRLPPFILKTYTQALAGARTRDLRNRYLKALQLCRQGDVTFKSTAIPEALVITRIIETLAATRAGMV